MVGQARILSPKEIKNIFQLLPTARDKAMFAIGIYTGLRVGEIVALRADQVARSLGRTVCHHWWCANWTHQLFAAH